MCRCAAEPQPPRPGTRRSPERGSGCAQRWVYDLAVLPPSTVRSTLPQLGAPLCASCSVLTHPDSVVPSGPSLCLHTSVQAPVFCAAVLCDPRRARPAHQCASRLRFATQPIANALVLGWRAAAARAPAGRTPHAPDEAPRPVGGEATAQHPVRGSPVRLSTRGRPRYPVK